MSGRYVRSGPRSSTGTTASHLTRRLFATVPSRVRPARPHSLPRPVTYEIDAPPRPAAGRSLPSWPTGRPLRAWQQAAAAAVFDHSGEAFLASATPAAGKTTFGLHVAHRMLSEGRVARVAVVAPTTHICRQWALDAARYGIHLEPNRPNSAGPEPRDRHGVAVTYATVAAGAGGAPAALRGAADAADRRRAAPHGRGRDVGAHDGRGVRARALPAAAVGHAVPLGQLADPVGVLRRGGRLAAPTTTTATRRRWSTASAGR